MDSKLDLAIDGFVDTVGQIGAGLGLSKAASQLYGLLYISTEPLSLDDMVKRLGVSKGNVSVNIRALEKWGAVRKVWVKGDRKDYYVAVQDTFRVVSEQLKIGLSRRLDDVMGVIKRVEDTMRDEAKEMSKDDRKRAKGYLARIGKAKVMTGKIKGLLETASKISKII